MIEELEREYWRAVAQEQLVREVAFLPVTESIAGFQVLPMTLSHYIALRVAGSPFVVGGVPGEKDAFIFLWHLSPHYSAKSVVAKRRRWRECRSFLPPSLPRIHWPWAMRRWEARREVRAIHFLTVKSAIEEYCREAMQDRPASQNQRGTAYWSDVSWIVHRLASAYGWTIDEIMKAPMKAIFQCYKILAAMDRAASGKQPCLFNPSDQIQGRILEVLNQN